MIMRFLFKIFIFVLCLKGICCDLDKQQTLKNAKLVQEDYRSNKYLSKRAAFCPANTQCVPLSSCPLLNNILNNECVIRNNIEDLACGYQGSGLVCCPFIEDNKIPTSTTPGKKVDGVSCGQSQVEGDGYDGIGAYPWVARIGFRNILTGEVKYPCTGSIINNRLILTAAHCALAKAENYKLYFASEYFLNMTIKKTKAPRRAKYRYRPLYISEKSIPAFEKISMITKDSKHNETTNSQTNIPPGIELHGYQYSVRVGEWQTNVEIDCGPEFCGLPAQDIGISHVIVHPGYNKPTFQDNIALLVLKNKVNYTVTAQPICLPEEWSVTNNNGILVGWGKTARQTVTPPQQQTLLLPIVSINQCRNVYGKTLPVTENHVCAGGDTGNDACSGFGGAPLLVKHSDTYYQVGILSFGSDQCGAPGVPSVYTNVKKYVQWIRDNSPKLIQ